MTVIAKQKYADKSFLVYITEWSKITVRSVVHVGWTAFAIIQIMILKDRVLWWYNMVDNDDGYNCNNNYHDHDHDLKFMMIIFNDYFFFSRRWRDWRVPGRRPDERPRGPQLCPPQALLKRLTTRKGKIYSSELET